MTKVSKLARLSPMERAELVAHQRSDAAIEMLTQQKIDGATRTLREKLEKARTIAETKLLEFLQTHSVTLIELNAEAMVQKFGIELVEALRALDGGGEEK